MSTGTAMIGIAHAVDGEHFRQPPPTHPSRPWRPNVHVHVLVHFMRVHFGIRRAAPSSLHHPTSWRLLQHGVTKPARQEALAPSLQTRLLLPAAQHAPQPQSSVQSRRSLCEPSAVQQLASRRPAPSRLPSSRRLSRPSSSRLPSRHCRPAVCRPCIGGQASPSSHWRQSSSSSWWICTWKWAPIAWAPVNGGGKKCGGKGGGGPPNMSIGPNCAPGGIPGGRPGGRKGSMPGGMPGGSMGGKPIGRKGGGMPSPKKAPAGIGSWLIGCQ
mmetsp:Transcript_65971/g.174188  ORF Transcript_65971/g.174188 Transcript_65971/m.174188 type:complete len:270 (+) Transcript_65971:154-963(+)